MADSPRREGPAEWTLGERYRVGREIGRGSYGVVYRATDLRSARAIALKLVDLDRDGGGEDATTERAGAELQQRFGRTHPDLVPEVFDYGEIGGYYTIAMEWIEAPSLSQTLSHSGPLSDERSARIALAITRFLDKAHKFRATPPGAAGMASEPIVHGDLKPPHIMLMPDGTVRVLDFGIAHGLSTSRTSATARGTSTPYASPELLETGRVRPGDDRWALGIMLFEMLAGLVPYQRYTTRPSLEHAIRTGALRDPLSAATNPVLAAIVDKLLRPQPEHRYPSAAAIGRDLNAFLDGEPTVAAAEAATAETVRVPVPAAGRVPSSLFNVPTLPVDDVGAGLEQGRIDRKGPAGPGVTGTAAAATAHTAPPPIPPPLATPAARARMPKRRRLLLMLAIPIGISMLNAICEGQPRSSRVQQGGDVSQRRESAEATASSDVIAPLEMEFVSIPPGEFTMGCLYGERCGPLTSGNREYHFADPPHVVRLTSGFDLGKFEVTRGQWWRQMARSVTQADVRLPSEADHQLPVVVSWDDTEQFLSRLNARKDGYRYRLPTEAEWEYAARAGRRKGHNDQQDEAWYLENSGRQPHAVGLKRANPWGLHDMQGNVLEWVQDWLGPYRDLGEPIVDPQGPQIVIVWPDHRTRATRVLRGGSWRTHDRYMNVSYRNFTDIDGVTGFRIVRVPAAEGEEP